MELPKEYQKILIEPSFNKIFYFKRKSFNNINKPKSPPPHNHICLPLKDDKLLCLMMINSNIDDVIDRCIKRDIDLNTIVHVNPDDINILITASVIDCNNTFYGTKDEVINDIDGNIKVKITNIPEIVVNRIVDAILLSDKVKPEVKKQVQYLKQSAFVS